MVTGVLVGRVKPFTVERMDLGGEEESMGDVIGKLVETSGVSKLEVLVDKGKLLFIDDLAELVKTSDDERGELGVDLVRLSKVLKQE